MTATIMAEMEAMRQRIADASPLITRCTWDATQIKPPTGEVHAYLQVPDLEWARWEGWSSTYTLVIAAGTWRTQAQAIPLLLQAIQDMQDAGVNLITASSASWKLADSTDLIAAYEITVETDSKTERMMQDG